MQKIDRQMMRLLHGELSEVERRDLEQLFASDSDVQARYCKLERAWQDLEELPPTPPNRNLAVQVMERVRRQGRSEFGWSTAPTWARSGAALALTLGLALGITLAESGAEPPSLAVMDSSAFDGESFEEDLFVQPLGMAESWWRALEASSFAEADSGGDSFPEDSFSFEGRSR